MRLLTHENVLSITNIIDPGPLLSFKDLYIVSDYMDSDLGKLIKSDQSLSDDHIQFLLYQILRGLKYVHSCGILHRDLKPRNLLVNKNCDLKICDFGLSRANITSMVTPETLLTDYITTRWYRPPEVILSCKNYSGAIDVWSVGCILAEMMQRKPLFPATNEQELMNMIVNNIGSPCASVIELIEDPEIKKYMMNLPQR
jgi:mitogen-activated protein kinase 1/2